MLKKILKISALVLLLLLVILAVLNYHSDIPFSKLKDKYSLPSSQFVEIKGMPVHYTIEGEGEKDLLLIHGTGSSLHDWEDWMPYLHLHFRIIRLDLPGFGLTGPNPQNRYDRIFYQVFLEAFANKVGLKDFHIVGNSFGGYVAWNYTIKNPNKVDRLVLLNSSGYPMANKKLPIGFRLAANETLAPLMKKITPKSIIRKTVLAAYEEDSLVTDELVNRYFELLLREGNREALMGKTQQIKKDNWQSISSIRHPTLIIWGELDEVVPAAHAYRFHKDMPQSELIMYEGIGHMPMKEIPEKSAFDLLEFLDIAVADR